MLPDVCGTRNLHVIAIGISRPSSGRLAVPDEDRFQLSAFSGVENRRKKSVLEKNKLCLESSDSRIQNP